MTAHGIGEAVRPDPAELSPDLMAGWLDRHDLGEGHRHIHGANLSIRGDVYLRIGGFAAIAAHEDRQLVRAARAWQARIVRTGDSPVLTSARVAGRTPTGMASYLRHLRDDLATEMVAAEG